MSSPLEGGRGTPDAAPAAGAATPLARGEPTMSLSRGDHAVLRFVRAYVLEHGFSPSIREIAASVRGGLGLTHKRVMRLVGAGALVQGSGSRSLSVPLGASAVTFEFPVEMDRQLRALASKGETTIEAVVIECVRDRLALLDRSDFVAVKHRKSVSGQSEARP